MIISMAAPGRGLGQTVTGINIAATISKITNSRSLIIDSDSCFGDVEHYLSNTYVTKGLDDFCSLVRSNMFSDTRFSSCRKNVHEIIDIMSANQCYELSREEIYSLCSHIKGLYSAVLIDTTHDVIPLYIDVSDMVIILLNQSANTVQRFIKRKHLFKPIKDKILFIINCYDNTGIRYGITDIKSDLSKAGFNNRIFTLSFESGLLNDANEGTLLNFILNSNPDKCTYLKQIKGISNYLLGIKEDECSGKSMPQDKANLFDVLFNNRFTIRNSKSILRSRGVTK